MFRGGLAFFELYELGVKLYFYDRGPEPLDLSDPTRKLVFQVELFGGEFYRASGQFKTTAAMRDLARGGFSTGHKLYGYRSVPTVQDAKKKLARYEIVPEEAAVVRRVFEMADTGLGDLKIAHVLNNDKVPGPRATWSKETIRTMLRSETYKGVLVHGKTKSITRGGNTQVRVHLPEKEWIVTLVPDMKIVEPELWDRVQARKARTKARYMRAPNGTLLGKPESGLMTARCLLTGFLRCSVCGGGMTHMRKNNRAGRYYCIERSRRG